MPIFEYICRECGNSFELMVLDKNSSSATCTSCGSDETKKQLSSFSALSSLSKSGQACNPAACGMAPGANGMPACGGGRCPG